MYVEDRKETVILARSPDGQEFRVSVDPESQARMMNEGWEILEEEREFIRPITEDRSFSPEGNSQTS